MVAILDGSEVSRKLVAIHFSDSAHGVKASANLYSLIETAKAHIRAKVEHQFRVIKQQFGFQKTRLRGLALPRPQAERGGATGVAASPM